MYLSTSEHVCRPWIKRPQCSSTSFSTRRCSSSPQQVPSETPGPARPRHHSLERRSSASAPQGEEQVISIRSLPLRRVRMNSPTADDPLAGVRIKEEPNDHVTEETCLEIKEEPFDYEVGDALSDARVKREGRFLRDLQEARQEARGRRGSGREGGDAKGRRGSGREGGDAKGLPFVEKEKAYRCEICHKTFSVKSHLVRHMRVHTKEKPYGCEICGKAFTEKCTLIRHMRVHTKEKPYSCEICKKAFSENTLVRHMRVHTKEKPYSCEICSKAFSHKTSIVSHMRVHTKEKPYSCEICSKAFSQKQIMVRHMRIHTKEKPYMK
ncbi:zinc finger protein 189-like [Penaeus chinensis]|uniref:zinc finger protein 189-like n=1 Tax=Penaeus chinensis TaxID=139456 RepID=UPI001FB6CF3D|nr:zinc finger protein 189-like [Penaeus chinensis]